MALRLAEPTDIGGLATDASIADDAAFTQLYLRYLPRLINFVLRKTGDRLLAEDIAQETVLRAVDHLDAFDYSLPMWPWLKAIASNLVIDHARKAAREVLTDRVADGGDEAVYYESGALLQAIECLPRRQKIAVALRYLDDWEPREIANFLGLNRGALEQLLFRARRRLRSEYSKLSESALGVVFLKIRSLRRLGARVAEQARAVGNVINPMGGIGAEMTAQIASGIIAVVAGLASTAAPAPPVASFDVATGTRQGVVLQNRPAGKVDVPNTATGGGPSAAQPSSGGNGGVSAAPNVDGSVRGVGLPQDDVREPEDASLTSVVLQAGRGTEGERAYASGYPLSCGQRCYPVLFRSLDGGNTWKRLPARGFLGESLLAPPSPLDTRIFAMGSAGLQVSLDGGRTFIAAAPNSPVIAGSAAISPAFDSGDPTILIGTETLLRYDDSTRLITPQPISVVGPLHPSFAPQYPSDDRILIGAATFDPDSNANVATVHTCSGSMCTSAPLGPHSRIPRVRPAPTFSDNGLAFAFTREDLFVSTDGAASFDLVETPWTHSWLLEVAPTRTKVFAALSPFGSHADTGIYASSAPFTTWTHLDDPLLQDGVRSLAADEDRLLAALEDNGLACSSDDGRTWSRRCN